MSDVLSKILDRMNKGAAAAGRGRGRGAEAPQRAPSKKKPTAVVDPELIRWRRGENEKIAQGFVTSLFANRPVEPAHKSREPVDAAVGRAVESAVLFSALREACSVQGLPSEPNGALLRWLLTQKMIERSRNIAPADPVFPSSPVSDPGLVFELRKAGVPAQSISDIERAIGFACALSVRRIGSISATGTGVVQVEEAFPSTTVSLRGPGMALSVTASTYRRLREAWHGSGGDDGFREDAFRLLARYDAFPGGDSYQAAMPPRVFALLRDRLGVSHECFASPLNRSFEIAGFSSAFADVDAPFGSSGDFFDVASDGPRWKAGGSFEANPPFVEEMMLALAMVIARWLDECPSPLSFVVVFPDWQDTPALELLVSDKRCRRVIRLLRRDHVYLSGAQHRPKAKNTGSDEPELISYSETCVIVLQNDLATQRWPFTDALETDFRAAFSRPDDSAVAPKKQSTLADR